MKAQTVIAHLYLIDIGRSPARRTDPDLAFAVAVAVHQLGDFGAGQIEDRGDAVCFGKFLGDAEALLALIGIRGQRDIAGAFDIFVGEALLVRQPDIRVDVDVAIAGIHRCEDCCVVAGNKVRLAADAAGDDFLHEMRNCLRARPCRRTDIDFLRAKRCRRYG